MSTETIIEDLTTEELHAKVLSWITKEERSPSAKVIAAVLAQDMSISAEAVHPTTPEDFAACRRLLAEIPELESSISNMSFISDKWSLLVTYWLSISNVMDYECRDWATETVTKAPDTTKIMKQLGCDK